jgi:hypothetical protein
MRSVRATSDVDDHFPELASQEGAILTRLARILRVLGVPRPRTCALALLLAFAPIACATLEERGEALVPTRYQVRTGPFLVYSNTPVAATSPAIRCLQALETDLTTRLAYRPRPEEEPVEIYVLQNRNAYHHFLQFYYPELPTRRAFFLSQGDRRVVYTYMSDRLEEDLRHEATHALLRGCYGDLPLWLDEGIAEYFERRPDSIDSEDEHLVRLQADLKQGWQPDLKRLEGLKDIHQMSPRDYREAWAWVHLMLGGDSSNKALLMGYLDQGRAGNRPGSLYEALNARGTSGTTLLAHLKTIPESMAVNKPHGEMNSGTASLVRFQDMGTEIPPPRGSTPTSRTGLLRRLRLFLGL